MPEICDEISSEIHLTEIDYVEQIKGNSLWISYFGNLGKGRLAWQQEWSTQWTETIFWRETHSKPSRRCYFEGRKNCDPKVAKRHYKEEATLSTSRLRQHDETHLRYCILASNVTWDTTSGRKLWHLHRPRNNKETLRCMKKGKPRGAKIGVDLFEIKGRNYLVTVDNYSNCLKVDYLSTTTTKQVITKLKGHFVRYGIPLHVC